MQERLQMHVKDMEPGTNYQIVEFEGDLDKAGFNAAKTELDQAVKNFASSDGNFVSLVFDFTKLKFINSESIGYLMEVHTHLQHNSKKLVLIGPNDHVEDVLKAIGIVEVIAVHPTLEEFLKQG